MNTPKDVSSMLRRIASKIDNSKKPDKNLVANALKKVLATLSYNPFDKWNQDKLKDFDKINEVLYGRTKPWGAGVGEEPGGSYVYWMAFDDLGVVDWIPGLDPEPIFKKTREIAEILKKKGKNIDPVYEENAARQNYKDYVDGGHEQEYKNQLNHAGLWP